MFQPWINTKVITVHFKEQRLVIINNSSRNVEGGGIYSSLCEEPSKRKQWALYSLTKRIMSVSWVLVRLPNEPTCAALTHISSSHPHLGFKAGPTVQQSEGCLKAEVSTSISLTHNAIWSMGSNKCNHRIITPSFSLHEEEDAHLCRLLTVNERLMRKWTQGDFYFYLRVFLELNYSTIFTSFMI